MLTTVDSIQSSLLRQVNHWLQAATRLSDLDKLASANAWHGIDHNIGVTLKKSLQQSVNDVISLGNTLRKQLESSKDQQSLRTIKRG